MMSRIFIISLALLIVVGLGAHFVSEALMGGADQRYALDLRAGADNSSDDNVRTPCKGLHGASALPALSIADVSSALTRKLADLGFFSPLSFSPASFHPPRIESSSLSGLYEQTLPLGQFASSRIALLSG